MLTLTYFVLQAFGLIINLYITHTIGTTAVGIISLITSFFYFVLVISNANIFISTSRFVSEEFGKVDGNPKKVMRYSLILSALLSITICIILCIFSSSISINVLKNESARLAIIILGISLPLATIGSCLKGYFHAVRNIKKPAIADIIEFSAKTLSLVILMPQIDPKSTSQIYMMLSISIISGEILSSIYLTLSYLLQKQNHFNQEILSTTKTTMTSFKKYIINILPIALSAYVFVLLSSANEALVPLTLHKFCSSADRALSEYGIFEAIIIPVIFFPTIILNCLSVILVPEIARESSFHNKNKVKYITNNVLTRTFTYSIMVSSLLFLIAEPLGMLLSSDPLTASSFVLLFPVLPFIYLEIVLEGIIKGLGRQNFSTINQAVEYILRIACVVIFVPRIGFNGIIISYYVSNIVSNICLLYTSEAETVSTEVPHASI